VVCCVIDFFRREVYTNHMKKILLSGICFACLLWVSCQKELNTEQKRISYGIGYNLGQQSRFDYERGNLSIDYEMVLRGFRDGILGKEASLPREELQREIENFVMQEQGKINSEKGRAFLERNKTQPGVVQLPDGIQYKILKAGTGPKPKLTDTVVCDYLVRSLDGEVIQSSYAQGEPVEFRVDGVISGWTEILQLMPVGSKWEVVLPPEFAYGQSGSAEIGPSQTLVFEIELLKIK